MLAKGREEKQRAFGEIAVLARTNRQLDGIRRCLRQEGIPCAEARADFLESPAVSGTLAFFAALAGGNEQEAENFLGGRENFEAAREKFLPQMNPAHHKRRVRQTHRRGALRAHGRVSGRHAARKRG